MIKKLIKNDIKKMMKILVYLYACSIILAGITRLINIGKNIQFIFIIGQVFAGITYSAIGSVLINTFVHILRVFVVNFYKDESYLTHTLPVTKNQLLLSKYLAALIVVICSVIVSTFSLLIIFYTPTMFTTLKAFLATSIIGLNIPSGLFFTLLIILIFSQICLLISMSFTAIIRGNMYNNKKTFMSFVWFGLFYLISNYAMLMVCILVFAISGNLNSLFANILPQGAFITILIIGLIVYIAMSIIFYFVSRKLFNKGVNVD